MKQLIALLVLITLFACNYQSQPLQSYQLEILPETARTVSCKRPAQITKPELLPTAFLKIAYKIPNQANGIIYIPYGGGWPELEEIKAYGGKYYMTSTYRNYGRGQKLYWGELSRYTGFPEIHEKRAMIGIPL
ncbi:MAG: hypothetical protein H6765_08790 [Candidatus Peribacteria bacterium]|nr:MAG: hypothetical protein H6765_08790 [Candidatus Peribacteria bacterium]